MGKTGAAATGIYTEATRYDIYIYAQDVDSATLIHEALHSQFRIDDLALATKLGVRDAYISTNSSSVITDELKNAGCQ